MANMVYSIFSRSIRGGGEIPTNNSDGERMLEGFVVSVLRVSELLDETFDSLSISNVSIYLKDVNNKQDSKYLAYYSVDKNGQAHYINKENVVKTEGKILWTKTFHYGQRNWQLGIEATQQYITENYSWTAWGVLTGGLFVTSLLGGFLLILSGRTILDEERKRELAAEIERRESAELALHKTSEWFEKLAKTDPLTQILNRRSIADFANQFDAEIQRYDKGYSVLMVDIDYFKKINDAWGHSIGDEVLKDVTNRISSQLRDVDVFGRWGGEEFVILAKNINLAESIEFANRICVAVNIRGFKQVGRVTVSIGVASSEKGKLFENFLSSADKALYLAKKKGRDRVESYSVENNKQ